jgi:hypothetical protein
MLPMPLLLLLLKTLRRQRLLLMPKILLRCTRRY